MFEQRNETGRAGLLETTGTVSSADLTAVKKDRQGEVAGYSSWVSRPGNNIVSVGLTP